MKRIKHAAAIMALIALAACQQHGGTGAPAGGPPQAQPAPVRTAIAETMRVPVEVSAFGNAEPLSTVELRAQVGGQVMEVLFKEGDPVTQGQELFRIDPRPFELALAQAEANLARYEAEVRQAEANLRQSEVQAANADVELQRHQTLLQREIVTQEEFDRARTAADAMRASTGASSAAVLSARENIRAAQAQIDNAKLDIERATLRAPMDGRTGNLMIHAGDIVSPSAADPMVLITQMKPMYVSFTLPERYLPQLRPGLDGGNISVRAYIPESDQPPVAGTLTFIDNTVDRVTSTIRLKATFDNDDEALWPGQYVDVRVELDVLENVVTVPARAVQTSQEGTYTYVIRPDNTAELRKVTTGPAYEDRISISEGIQAGEAVVTDGHLRIKPDGPVKILNEDAPPEQPAS